MIIMLTSTHRRILADGQERARQSIAKANDERDGARQSVEQWRSIARARGKRVDELRAANSELSTQVERLTPNRDAKGHYIKQERAS